MVVQLVFPALAAEADVKVQPADAVPAFVELLPELPVATEEAAEVVVLPLEPELVFVAIAVAEAVVVVLPFAFGMGVADMREATLRTSPTVGSI